MSLDDFNDADLGSLQSTSFNPRYTQKLFGCFKQED